MSDSSDEFSLDSGSFLSEFEMMSVPFSLIINSVTEDKASLKLLKSSL